MKFKSFSSLQVLSVTNLVGTWKGSASRVFLYFELELLAQNPNLSVQESFFGGRLNMPVM